MTMPVNTVECNVDENWLLFPVKGVILELVMETLEGCSSRKQVMDTRQNVLTWYLT